MQENIVSIGDDFILVNGSRIENPILDFRPEGLYITGDFRFEQYSYDKITKKDKDLWKIVHPMSIQTKVTFFTKKNIEFVSGYYYINDTCDYKKLFNTYYISGDYKRFCK